MKKTLYANMLDAVRPQYSETENLVSELSDASLPEDAFTSGLAALVEAGATLRQDATGFLTSDAVSSFDEPLVYEAKRHVHTDVGRVLMQTRLYLQEGGAPDAGCTGQEALLAAWREVLASLKTGTWRKESVDVKKQITDAATAAGVSVVFENEPPTEEADLRAYVKDATAKILVAVRAGEDTVFL